MGTNNDETYTSFDHLESNPFADVIIDTNNNNNNNDHTNFIKKDIPPHWIGVPATEIEGKGLLKRDIIHKLDEIDGVHIFKLIFFGDMSVGKTSLIVRTNDNQFYGDACQPTVGVDFVLVPMKIDEMYVKVEFWDTAGQERFRSILRTYYKKASEGGVVLVYDVGNRKTFQNLDNWIQEICEKGDIIRKHGNNNNNNNNKTNNIEINNDNINSPPFILLGNKNDLAPEEREVTYEEGKAFATSRNMLFYEVSALDSTNVTESLQSIIKVMYDHALEYGIARSSIQIDNERLLKDAEERRKLKLFKSCGCQK